MPNRSAPEEAKRGNEVNMSHFYFVRHGQTVWNVENKICGATDSPLTDKGHEQARVTGRILRDKIDHGEIHIDEILTSPLSRAYDTAVEISRIIQVPVQAEPRLTEQNFGKWEGTARNGVEFAKAKENFVDSYGGGESMMRLAQRIYNLIDDIRKEPEKTYLLVAHNGISRMIESYFRDMSNEEFAAFGIKNAEVVEYQFDGIVPDCRADYDLLCRRLQSLMEGVASDVTILSNASALLYQTLPKLNWAGFYIASGDELMLGPFQGKTACIRNQLERDVSYRTFLDEAPSWNPDSRYITGKICGVKIEEIEDPTMRRIRCLDKVIDELAKGRPLEKIMKRRP